MNSITTQTVQLPDKIADLTQFVLVGKAKLQAYMIKLQTVNKLSVAQEIRDQTLKEAQEISTAVIAAEQRIGELLLAIPKQSGARTDLGTSAERMDEVKPKSEVIAEMGYDRHEAHDYQQMAKHPEVVQMVIDKAIERGDVVTKTQVLKEIKAAKEQAKAEAEENRSTREKLEKSRADRLQAEVEELKKRKPEIMEVETVPDDYEQLKRDAKHYRELAKTNKASYDELMSKYTKKCNEARTLSDKVNDLEHITMEGLETGNLSENVFFFCAICNNFISNVGGLVWLTERISDMPSKEREMYMKAARAFTEWAVVFKGNLERSIYDAEKRADAGVPLLPDQR